MSYEPIEAIPAVAPTPSLTTSARPLPDGVRWQSGLSFRDNGARTHGAWPYAPGAAHADKATFEPIGPQVASFVPVMLYVPLECDEVTARAEDEMLAELRAEIDATSAFSLARAMAGSVGEEWALDPACGLAQNPTLSQPYPGHAFGEADPDSSTGNVILTGDAGDHPVAALGELLEAYSALTRKGGATVHVEVRLLPHLLSLGAVNQQGAMYVGPLGSIVVPHFELPGPAADDAGAPTAPAAGNSWMYATGPVQFAMDAPRVLPEGERWRRMFGAGRTNLWQVLVERLAIVRWNPSVVVAVEALEPVAGV